MTNEIAESVINKIIELLHDSQEGYRECAEMVSDTYLKRLFTALSDTREKMIKALEQEARNRGIAPEKTGTLLAVAHRLFIDLKGLVTGGDAKAIMNEIKKGETSLIANYQDVLRESLPLSLRELLQAQLSHVQANLTQATWQIERPEEKVE